jgi:uncharacterized membrane protein
VGSEDRSKPPVPIYLRLADVEARLARLEAEVYRTAKIEPPPIQSPTIPPVVAAEPPPEAAPSPLPNRDIIEPLVAPAPFVPDVPPVVPIATRLAEARKAALQLQSTMRKTPLSEAATKKTTLDIEKLIAERWYALAGGLVVIIGACLGVSYAYQKGLFDLVSGPMRCLIAAIFGALLLATAEVARRKINAWAAVGLNAAGLGTLYVSAFTAYSLYHQFSNTTAILLLVACTALGVFIGVRGRLVAVAIVAIIGGYLAPILVGSSGGNAWVLPPYWLMLLATGLILAGWKGEWFIILRWLTGWATIGFGTIWVLIEARNYPILALSLPGAPGLPCSPASDSPGGPRRWGSSSRGHPPSFPTGSRPPRESPSPPS